MELLQVDFAGQLKDHAVAVPVSATTRSQSAWSYTTLPDSTRSIAEVARDLGVGEQLLGHWVKVERIRSAAAGPAAPDTPALTETERAELVRLRRKVVDQERKVEEQERDINFLKKASAYFAAMQPK